MLIRSWNLFHGNTVPPGRGDELGAMVRLVTGDEPDLVCVQEVPLWALPELERWSGMRAYPAPAAPARIGPFPSTPAIGRALTSLNHGLFRSAFTGQANAVLAARRLRAADQRLLVLNDRRFRRAQARWLGLGTVARLAWAKERRVCQTLRLLRPDGAPIVLAHLHATSSPRDPRLPDAEVFRTAVFADGLADPGDALVIAGDLNIRDGGSRTLEDLTGPEWGFVHFGHSVDHLLVRGATLSRARVWPESMRRRDGRLLSDHAPIEAVLA
jgi:endonuclease/exonuclease/phosphatase family metal-dependent hydrolase